MRGLPIPSRTATREAAAAVRPASDPTVASAALCLGQLLHDHPDRHAAEATDQVTEDLLRMFGLPADEAHQISQRQMLDVGDVPDRDAAA